jgi:hypothetical protein
VKKSTTRRPHAPPDPLADPRPALPRLPDRTARPPQLLGGDGDAPPTLDPATEDPARSSDQRRLRALEASEPDDPNGVSRAQMGDEGTPDRVLTGGVLDEDPVAARMASTSSAKSVGGIGAGGGRSLASVCIMISASPGTCAARPALQRVSARSTVNLPAN